MIKWLLRVLVGLIGVVAVSVLTIAVLFSLWRADRIQTLNAGSAVIATPLGAIEFATLGAGVPMLILHGTPGGYDQALIARRTAPERYRGIMTIAVSRPGYLRTPLRSGATFQEQADLFAALLDELGIDRVVVYAASGGGYAGLQFALRHPDRTLGLILYAPSVNYEPLPEGALERIGEGALMRDLTMWAMSGPLIGVLAPSILAELDPSTPAELEMTRRFLVSATPAGAQLDGLRNDILQRDDPAIDDWPLARIAAPTLILHGNADENSAYEGSVAIAAKIPNAKLVTFEGGDHFIVITRADEVRSAVNDFLKGLADQSDSEATI